MRRPEKATGTRQGAPNWLRPCLLASAVALCFAQGAARANPSGGSVASGSASFAVNGKTLTITNTPGAIINWQQFSIQKDEITRFVQQNAASAVLNRVVGQNPSLILGRLSSNGRVFLINPSGIAFGQGAVIDVAGFAASTLNINDADFVSGRMRFLGSGAEGKLSNAGTIRTAEGGHVYLIAPNVENQKGGVITSPKGEVVIAAGKTVELVNSRTPELRVEFVAPDNQAVNAGEMVAASGSIGIYGTLIRNSGRLSASRAEVGDGGKIVLKASRQALIEGVGRIEATGTRGGQIQVLGPLVGLVGEANLDASGELGGGTVLVGGDFQGKNPQVQNAGRTYVGEDVIIRADATVHGDGGKVVVWSDEITRYYGAVSARGGEQGGDGGLVEVSGKTLLDFRGRADTGAPAGRAGTVLLDPLDITIQDTGGASNGELTPTTDESILFADGAGAFTLSDETLEALNGNVVLQATRDIIVGAGLSGGLAFVNQTGGERVVLQAGRHIEVNSALSTSGAALWLEADSPHQPGGADGIGLVAVKAGAPVSSGGGAITLIGAASANPQGGFKIDADVNAGAGGISVGLSQTTGDLDFFIGAGGNTQLTSSDTGSLKTTGALALGRATTAGSDGLGAGAQTVTVNSLTNATASPIQLSADSGSSFELYAGGGGVLLDRPLTTYQDTVINTSGALTINQTLATTHNDLTIVASSVTLGASGSVNVGNGVIVCTATGCGALPTTQVSWDGGGGDFSWFNPLNWSNDRLPTLASDVTIPDTAAGVILIGSGATAQAKSLVAARPIALSAGLLELMNASTFVEDLALSAGSLTGSGGVSISGPNGSLTWSGGAMAAGGTFFISSGRSGTLSGSLVLDRTLRNEGTLTFSGAAVSGAGDLRNGGALNVAAGTASTISTPLLNKSVDPATLVTTLGNLTIAGSLTATSFPANAGAITIHAGGALATGNASLDNESTGTLVSAGSLDLGTGSFTNSGSTTFNSATTIATLNLSAGSVGGSGDLSVTTDFNQTGGSLGTTFSDLLLTKGGAFTVDAGGFTAVDSVTLRSGGRITLNGAVTATSGTGASVVLAGSAFTNNAGASALNPGTGRWLVWSADPAADVRGGLAYDFKQYNASFGVTAPAQSSGNGFLFTLAPTVTAGVTGTVSKTYDATAAATLAALNYTVSGAVDGDSVALNDPVAGLYGDKHAGSGKVVSVNGLAIRGATNGAATVYGYQLASTSASANIGTILQASLTGSITADNKTYDATTAATISGRSLTGVIAGDAVSYTGGTATFADKNAGTGKTVTATGLSLTGGDAGNYTVNTTAAATADISPATLTAGLTGSVAKTYDASTAALLAPANYTLGGVVGGDAVQLNNPASGVYDTKNAGTGKMVTASGLALSGSDAGNYVVNAAASAPIGTIDPRVVSLTGSRVYDGSTSMTAAVFGSVAGVAGETLALNGGGSVGSKDVAAGTQSVTLGTLALADGGNGGLASNYTLTGGTHNAAITPAALYYVASATSRAAGEANPPLDGTVSGFVAGETLASASSGALVWLSPADANSPAGQYAIDGGGLSILGGNYTLTQMPGNATALTVIALGLEQYLQPIVEQINTSPPPLNLPTATAPMEPEEKKAFLRRSTSGTQCN